MELTFKKEGNDYVAEFKAPGDFNLHLERNGKGSLVLSQSGVEQGAYERFYSQNIEQGKTIFDRDFGALVYPKWIKVVSGSEVVSASVNFNEGGGSGSGSGESESSWKYFDISNSTSDSYTIGSIISSYSHTVKVKDSDAYYIMQNGYFFANFDTSTIKDYVIAIAVDVMAYIRMDDESGITTIDEHFKLGGRTMDEVFSGFGFSEITKEQFVSL